MLHSSAALAAPQPESLSESDEAPAGAPQACVYRYRLRAVREPSVLPRVVEMFTLRDLIPADLRCRDCPEQSGHLLIELVAAGLTATQAENIAARMRNVVPVLAVLVEAEPA